MIYATAFALLVMSAGLVWLLGWLVDRGKLQRLRTILTLAGLSLLPCIGGLILLYLRKAFLEAP